RVAGGQGRGAGRAGPERDADVAEGREAADAGDGAARQLGLVRDRHRDLGGLRAGQQPDAVHGPDLDAAHVHGVARREPLRVVEDGHELVAGAEDREPGEEPDAEEEDERRQHDRDAYFDFVAVSHVCWGWPIVYSLARTKASVASSAQQWSSSIVPIQWSRCSW